MADRIADAIDGDERLLVEAGTGTGQDARLPGAGAAVGPQGRRQHRHQDAAGPDRDASTCRACARCSIAPACCRAARVGRDEGPVELRLPAPPRRARPRSDRWSPSPSWTRIARVRGRDRRRATAPTCAELADDAPLWGEIAATPETRIGPRCAYFESCFVTAMRRRAAAAPLIVVNHHLFFADLALRSALARGAGAAARTTS